MELRIGMVFDIDCASIAARGSGCWQKGLNQYAHISVDNGIYV